MSLGALSDSLTIISAHALRTCHDDLSSDFLYLIY
jgi:hypothetical protein